jgi:phospholipid-binding lipoprotein MlaA
VSLRANSRRAAGGAALLSLALLVLPASAAQAASAKDPFEGFNRSVASFNDGLDTWALKPLAEGYRKVVPELVRTGVSNVLGNIEDVWSAVNQALQGKGEAAASMTMRVVTNTFFGFGGLLDWATPMGMERQSEDFGQTLGRWGVPSGPYLVLPVFGPSTVRDAVALPLDKSMGATSLVQSTTDVVAVVALQAVSTRAGLLSASSMLDDIALDKYSFLRDLYLSRRLNQVYDGNPPDVPDEDPADSAAKPASAQPQN